MKPIAEPRVWTLLAWLAAAAAAVVGVLVMLDWTPDFTDRLRDDAFYEFVWAANVASGVGPVVSDGTTTSGVQWLWSLLLVPLAFGGGAGALPLLAPWLGFGLHAATAALIARSGRDRLAAGAAALCWFGNPLLLRECQNGQETALACLLLWLLWQHRRAGTVTFAVLAVLCAFARTDLVGVVAALSLVRHGRAFWRGLWLPIAIVLLQFAINAMLGGGVMPDSAAPMAWLWHSNHAATMPTLAESAAMWWWYIRPVLLGGPWATASALGSGLAVFVLVRPWWPQALRAVPPVLVGAAVALGGRDLLVAGWAALLLALLPATRRRWPDRELAALFLGAFALVTLHWALRWYPRDYYLAPLVVLATAALLRFGRLRWLLVLFAAAQLADLPRVGPEPLAGQAAMALAGRNLALVLPAGERVGCFNSGLVTFGADVLARGTDRRRGVVNLDGVVDARTFAALRAGRLADWLDRHGVRFVLDNALQFATDPRQAHANGHWFAADFDPGRDLVEVARFEVPGASSFTLYWRRGRGSPPPRPTAARDLGAVRGGRCVLWPGDQGERLLLEREDGSRIELAATPVRSTVILFVPAADLGSGRLFENDETEPLLTLPRL